MPSEVNIAIFASGAGSNAQRIIEHFNDRSDVRVALVITNKPAAGVVRHAFDANIPALTITRRLLNDREFTLSVLRKFNIDFIALAGFLLLVPDFLVSEFNNRIVNIHPALLPKYGGKGMYGMHVHKAVRENNERESGITIHYVNERYDEGNIVAQYSTPLEPSDTPEEIARKVQILEHQHYPEVIDRLIRRLQDQ